MAFSKTPQTSTYQTKEIVLLNEWESRDTSVTNDNDALNCFYELVQNKNTGERHSHAVKRDGTVAYSFVASAANIRGIHYWKDQNKLFVAVDDDIVIITASTGATVTTLTAAFGTTTGEVGFCEFLYDVGTVKIVATDGTTLLTIDSSNTKVVGADVDMPVHLPQPIFLDGTLYIVKVGTADLYNSDINDPLAFTSGNYITAEMDADAITRVVNLNNYLVVLGTTSIEYFWDAGNATGSPLQRYDSPIKHTGYLSGIAKTGNDLIFVGTNQTSGPQVYILSDLKIEEIGTPPIRRVTQPYTTAKGAVISNGGHEFYVLTAGSYSYALDLTTKLWTRWAYQTDTSFPIDYAYNINVANVGLVSLCALNGSATMVYFKPGIYQDNATTFVTSLTTDPQTFETYRLKTGSRLMILADRPTSNGTMDVTWSDDDYQTFSSARTVELNAAYPVLHQLGQFRRRAFKFSWTQNLPLRMQLIEIDLNMGQA